jgi:hypothetical protein
MEEVGRAHRRHSQEHQGRRADYVEIFWCRMHIREHGGWSRECVRKTMSDSIMIDTARGREERCF